MQVITSQRIYILVVIASVAVSAFTLASLFGRHPYLELSTHFRLQYALAATACLIMLAFFHSWRLIPLALCCAVVNLAFILPYYASASRPQAPPGAMRLRLMQANVLGGNKNYATLLAVVEEEHPDVLVLQEFTEQWQEQLRYPLSSSYPYAKLAPRQGGSGMALYSRYPLEEAEELTLDASSHIAISAKVNVDGIPLTVLALHPPTPMRPDKFANRNEQFARAAAIMRETQRAKVLIGDLNTTMWSPYFTDLVSDSGMSNARQGFGLMPSWPVPLPTPFQIPIDHCLVGGGVMVETMRTGGRTGSDHRPLIVEVTVERVAVPVSR